MSIVVTNIKKVSPSFSNEFSELGAATIHEAQARTGLLSSNFRPIYSGSKISGSAVTCEVAPGDNWMIHVAAEQCEQGDILVVKPTSPCTDGYFGDLLATSLKSRGVRGLIIEGGVRDVSILKEMDFPVWSIAISARGTVKETIANVNTPIVCGGVSINPGDIIVADDDGVTVVAQKDARKILEKGKEREANEEEKRLRFENGELGLDVYSMRERLAAKGLKYIEATSET